VCPRRRAIRLIPQEVRRFARGRGLAVTGSAMHTHAADRCFTLHGFSSQPLRYVTGQTEALDWLAATHAAAQTTIDGSTPEEEQAFRDKLRRVMDRCACGPLKIGTRSHVVSDAHGGGDAFAVYDVTEDPKGAGMAARMKIFTRVVDEYFRALYAVETSAPRDLIHVTCTGYVSPSGAQRLIAEKGWGTQTRVTHAYHMGCYAALSATRLAAASLAAPKELASAATSNRVDIVHTELCTLHLDPSNHAIEQLVVQSLFADGLIHYSLSRQHVGSGLDVLSLDECILPDSTEAMSWKVSDHGMEMTLARDVPERIGSALRDFVLGLYRKAGLDFAKEFRESIFAVHPGGPKIIDSVARILELSEAQVATSREVLFDHGNMSSATLPHIWMRLVADRLVARGALVVSLAFGPGLTICGGLFRKR